MATEFVGGVVIFLFCAIIFVVIVALLQGIGRMKLNFSAQSKFMDAFLTKELVMQRLRELAAEYLRAYKAHMQVVESRGDHNSLVQAQKELDDASEAFNRLHAGVQRWTTYEIPRSVTDYL